MEFTNDIRFNKKPKASKLLKITYSGTLYKNNSQEVSIVYGFGENWEKKTEQKMNKNARGFSYNILMENYNTLNFCFKNENNEWDNNNSFNYITPIAAPTITSPVNSVSSQEAQSIVTENIDNLVNNIDINFDNADSEKTVTTNSDSSLLDALIQELFEEYSNQAVNTVKAQTQVKATSPEVQTASNTDSELDKYFETEETIQEKSKVDSYNELSVLFDELIEETQSKTPEVNIGQELNQLFDNIFDEKFQPSNNTTETYIPEVDNSDSKIENSSYIQDLTSNNSKNVENYQAKKAAALVNSDPATNRTAYLQDITSEDSVMVERYQAKKAAALVNSDPATNRIAYLQDITSENSVMVERYQVKKAQMAEVRKQTVAATTVEKVEEKQNIFDFENLDFDFSIQHAIQTQTISANNFSDSFYDDEDLSTHDLNYEFQTILDDVMNSLSKETEPSVIEANNEDYQAQSEAFDKAVSEYADYFDNLIEEIVMSPVTALSSSVSNEQVFENEKNDLAVVQNESTAVANAVEDTSTDGVANEYALYDYKNHSFLYMMKRRFKLIFNSLFTKIPQIFGKETDNNNE